MTLCGFYVCVCVCVLKLEGLVSLQNDSLPFVVFSVICSLTVDVHFIGPFSVDISPQILILQNV